MSQSSVPLHLFFYHTPFLLVHFTLSYYVSSTLYYFATRAHLCIYFLLLPATGIHLFLPPGGSRPPTRKRSFSVFAESIGPCKVRFRSYPFASPRAYLCMLLRFHLVSKRDPFRLSLSSLLLLSCTSRTSLRTSLLLGFLLRPSIRSPIQRYPTLFQLALLLLSPIQLYQSWLSTSSLGCSLLHIVISTFSRISPYYGGTFPVLHLNTVLLAVLEHLKDLFS